MKKMVLLGFLLALSMILSYIESLIPLSIGIPGIKPGLANLVVVILLYTYGPGEALTVNFLRIILTGFLFGSLFSVLYSAAGAVSSFLIMLVLKKSGRFSVAGVSIGGGVFHNMGQLLAAMLVVETYAPAVYLPVLIGAGAFTGFITGIVSMRVLPYVRNILR